MSGADAGRGRLGGAGGPIRWGIVGTGPMADAFVSALRSAQGAEVVAIASREADRAVARARALGIPVGCTYPELLDRDDVDVVYVATPNHRHHDDCLAAIAAGKAVLCEKPLGCTAAEVTSVIDATRRQQVFCMEGLWTHFLPAVRKVDELLAGGTIGLPNFLVATFGTSVPSSRTSRFFDRDLGGGAILDRAGYTVSLAIRFLGEVASVAGQTLIGPGGVDVSSAAVLRFESGALAITGVSLTAYQSNEVVISGPKGRIVIKEPLTRPAMVTVETHAEPQGGGGGPRRGSGLVERLKKSRAYLLARSILKSRRIHVPYAGNGYVHEIEAVQDCLRAGKLESDVVPLSLSLRTLRVLDAWRTETGATAL